MTDISVGWIKERFEDFVQVVSSGMRYLNGLHASVSGI